MGLKTYHNTYEGETNREIEALVKEANKPDGQLAELKRERAKYEQDPELASEFDPFAGLDKDKLQKETDAAVQAEVQTKVGVETNRLKSLDDAAIAKEITKPENQGKEAELSKEKAEARAAAIKKYAAEQTTIITPQKTEEMQALVKAEKDSKLLDIDKAIAAIPCVTAEKCKLSRQQQSVVATRVEGDMTIKMSQYDDQHSISKAMAARDTVPKEHHYKEKAAEKIAAKVSASTADKQSGGKKQGAAEVELGQDWWGHGDDVSSLSSGNVVQMDLDDALEYDLA